MLANLRAAEGDMFDDVIEAVERTADKVVTHAKSDHIKTQAHAIQRYENQTTNLTNSIAAKWVDLVPPVLVHAVYAGANYAPKLEFGSSRFRPYPFLWPAFVANMETFKMLLAQISLRGRG